jgi:hypothetical protein
MGVPVPDMEPVDNASAEGLLDSLKTIDPAERRKHASVFNYWLSIRGNRQFPPIRDLDPIEISDAGPWSVLLEMIGGGDDAVVRHFGQAIRGPEEIERIADAAKPSLLSCIHAKLPIVAACREAYAFEETFAGGNGPQRCWVTLLPFSATGTWIDFVYGYVSLDGAGDYVEANIDAKAEPEEAAVEEPVNEAVEELVADVAEGPLEEEAAEEEAEPFKVPLAPLGQDPDELEAVAVAAEPEPEEVVAYEPDAEPEPVPEYEPEPEAELVADYEPALEAEFEEPESDERPSFTAKFMESIGGFYGKVVQTGPELPPEAFVEEPSPAEEEPEREQPAFDQPNPEPVYAVEGSLQNKLTDVRALADEAREAQIRSNIALYEGLSAAYDFALDAEAEPEEYLRLVEAQGLKIQLRSPMKPVVRLAFDGTCDEPTIAQLEAILSWALKHDLPRGTLAARIQEEGGIGQILNAKAA